MIPGTLHTGGGGGEDGAAVLLVEDEALISMAQAMALERAGYRVTSVSSGEQAVELCGRDEGIDLILMDINLGSGIDGTEAAALILQNRDVPIVFLSSYTDPTTVERAERVCSYGYVVKTSGIAVLVAALERALRHFESGRSL